MRRAVTFHVAVEGLLAGYHDIELFEHVVYDVWICAFVDGDPGGGVGHIDIHGPAADTGVGDRLLYLFSQVDHLLVLMGADIEAWHGGMIIIRGVWRIESGGP